MQTQCKKIEPVNGQKQKILSPGNLEYKYWVDGEWMHDPKNLRVCLNCFGTQNNIVKVIL